MMTLVVLCVLVVVVSHQPTTAQPTLEDILAEGRKMFEAAVQESPDMAVTVATGHLLKALEKAEFGTMALDEAAELILEEFRVFMGAAPQVEEIADFNMNVCKMGEFPFPTEATDNYPNITKALNDKVQELCSSMSSNSMMP